MTLPPLLQIQDSPEAEGFAGSSRALTFHDAYLHMFTQKCQENKGKQTCLLLKIFAFTQLAVLNDRNLDFSYICTSHRIRS